MIDLKDTTFIITLNLESYDRLRNAYIVLNYILSNFETNIIIKEVDYENKFSRLLPLIENSNNILHIFEQIGPDNIFHKSKYVNDMFDLVKTKVVCTYDIDVILPIESYKRGQDMCLESHDLVYPFEIGMNQAMLYLPTYENISDYSKFINYDNLMSENHRMWHSTYGHVQFFKSESFRNGFMMNENFSSYSPEDIEIGTRFQVLGYNVGRFDDKIIHIEHSRGVNSSESTPCAQNNNHIWNMLRNFNKEQFLEYYSNQEYYKKRVLNNE